MRKISNRFDPNLIGILTEQRMPLIFLAPVHFVMLERFKTMQFHHHLLVRLISFSICKEGHA